MLCRNAFKAVALTLVLVVSVVGLVLFIAIVFYLTDNFTIDRFLGIVGALAGFGWLVGIIARLLRYWFRTNE